MKNEGRITPSKRLNIILSKEEWKLDDYTLGESYYIYTYIYMNLTLN